MSADELKQAVSLIKAGKKIEARMILEPIIVSNPQNIQAWVWEIETRENDAEKIKLMEACLLHNPDSNLIKKALAALKTRQEFLISVPGIKPPEPSLAIRVDPFTEMTEYLSEPVAATRLKTCQFCGELIDESLDVCPACERLLNPIVPNDKPEPEIAQKTKRWYRHTWVKILLFIFLMPIWCVIELSDPDARRALKVFGGILLIFYINLISLFLYWFFTTNSSRANLYNWYQYLTGRADSATPGEFVHIEGSVQNPGSNPFSLVELEARVFDQNGNLLGNSTQYLDSSALIIGSPTHFQMDVTSLLSPFRSGMNTQQVLLFDDFSDPASGWQENSGEQGETSYSKGQYRITVDSANFDLWSNPGKVFTDTKVEVDTIKGSGSDSNRFGIQCRYSDPENYYFAVISSDGYYGIGKVVSGVQSFIPKNGMQVTDTIYAGTAVNHIRFDCVGTRLTLYVNGDYVDSVDDNDLKNGDVGLLAGTFEEKDTQVLFDNLVVFQP